MGALGGKVAIIGTGIIKFGENFHKSLKHSEAKCCGAIAVGLRLGTSWSRPSSG